METKIQTINKETADLNSIVDQTDLTDVCRTLQQQQKKCIHLKHGHNNLQERSHVKSQNKF